MRNHESTNKPTFINKGHIVRKTNLIIVALIVVAECTCGYDISKVPVVYMKYYIYNLSSLLVYR